MTNTSAGAILRLKAEASDAIDAAIKAHDTPQILHLETKNAALSIVAEMAEEMSRPTVERLAARINERIGQIITCDDSATSRLKRVRAWTEVLLEVLALKA